jgi:DNA-binding NtrC family response regulator
VLDDTDEVIESICGYLASDGFDACGFSEFLSLKTAIKRRPFDGYIIDWIIGAETAAQLIAEIRADDTNCPIVVLTGKAKDGDANVEDIARAVADHKAVFFQKPAVTQIIAAHLTQSLSHGRT